MRKALLLFGILNDEDVEWMLSVGIRRESEKGDVLIKQGEYIDSLFLLVDGLFKVVVGKTEVAHLTSGEILGELSLVDARRSSASVVAVERSLLMALPRTLIAQRLQDDLGFAARFYRAIAGFLADRLRASNKILGYGKAGATQEIPEYRDELDPEVLEAISVANMRFDQFQRRLH